MSEESWKDTIKFGRMSFRIYELGVIKHSLVYFLAYEKALNDGMKTVEPLDKIREFYDRINDILFWYNLRNSLALQKKKQLTLRYREFKILQNSLCITIGINKEYGFESEEVMEIVKRLHRRCELYPTRVAAGLKSKGYKLNEEKVRELDEMCKTHVGKEVINPL